MTRTQPTFTCSNSTIETPEKSVEYAQSLQKTPERRQRRRSGVFIVSIEHILLLFLVLLSLTLNK